LTCSLFVDGHSKVVVYSDKYCKYFIIYSRCFLEVSLTREMYSDYHISAF